jgi:hypothetical protein
MKTFLTAICIAGAGSVMSAEEHTATAVPHENHDHAEHHEQHENCAHDAHELHQDPNWVNELNAAVSLYIDTLYYHEDSDEGLPHIKEEMPGFGHGHEEDDHGHGLENGFNLREVELQLSGEVDEYFTAVATLAFTEDEVEVETAEIESTGLPWGFQLNAGKFYSDFGIVNATHLHDQDFADQPLIYELAFGDHGLNDIGIQASWLAPVPFHLFTGVEVFQGKNDKMFNQEEDDNLPEHDGPRLGVAWLKTGTPFGRRHTLRMGLFGGAGRHQEIHEETSLNYLDGTSYFLGTDALYRYDARRSLGLGDFTIQAEYFYRNKDLDLDASDDAGAPLGEKLDSTQDGYYVQALYGILPRLRAGLRWDQVGLINDVQEPGEATESFGDSHRASLMLDYSPSSSALIRLQLSNGEYETEEGPEEVWEGFVQLVVSLGTHHDHSRHRH